MATAYRQLMEVLYLACIIASGVALVVITLIIPYGVFMRYVLNSAASWPEPMAVLLMVLFSFVGGAAIYRAKVHISVQAMINALPESGRRFCGQLSDAVMLLTAGFMVYYGALLVATTWPQSIAEFPGLSVGLTYLPIPIGGAITLLFIIERLWLGDPPPESFMYSDQPRDLE